MREIIFLHIGQTGIQVGHAMWELACLEHNVGRDGTPVSLSQDDGLSIDSLFVHCSNGNYTPRALLIDLDPTVVDEVRVGHYRNLWNTSNLFGGPNSAGYTVTNRLLARLINALCLSHRYNFMGQQKVDIGELLTNLVPYPRIHFPTMAYAPFFNQMAASFETPTVTQMLERIYDQDNQLSSICIRNQPFIACALLFRGNISPFEETLASIINDYEEIGKSLKDICGSEQMQQSNVWMDEKKPKFAPGGDGSSFKRPPRSRFAFKTRGMQKVESRRLANIEISPISSTISSITPAPSSVAECNPREGRRNKNTNCLSDPSLTLRPVPRPRRSRLRTLSGSHREEEKSTFCSVFIEDLGRGDTTVETMEECQSQEVDYRDSLISQFENSLSTVTVDWDD
ncbi:Tubulin alpha-2 chain [Echinococcus granulosus]|nr:Tubulin alpha-2 chain [Echinococcus granulosus]